MAIVQNPIIGRAKNKLANVIFSTILDQNVLRSKPLTVANPRTPNQMNTRYRLSIGSKMARQLRNVLQITFKEGVTNMYPRNKFLSVNFQTITANELGQDTTNYQNLIVAQGTNTDPATGATAIITAGDLTINFTPGGGNTAVTCKTGTVFLKQLNKEFTAILTEELWTDGTVVFEDTDMVAGDIVYIFSYDEVTGLVSDSTAVVIA